MSFFKKLRGGGGKVSFVKTLRQSDGNIYDVYCAPTRTEALAFLREKEVKEERRYVIVETPEGNLGKDMILIFKEETGEMIELGKRNHLPRPRKSRTHCFCCGYPVLPSARTPDFGINVHSFISIVILEEMTKDGTGLVCPSCQSVCCAICASQAMSLSCVFCQRKMTFFRE